MSDRPAIHAVHQHPAGRAPALFHRKRDTTVALRAVTRRFITPGKEVFELNLEDEEGASSTLSVTPNHPFWVKDIGWTTAANLGSGLEVYSSSGGWLRVTGATWHQRRATVFNFEVAEFHTYFVGAVGAWVHNSCRCGPQTPKLPDAERLDDVVARFLGINEEPAPPTHTSPFYSPYDPDLPGGPDPARTIDTRTFTNPKGSNASGYPRDAQQFWKKWAERFPETLSDNNRLLIEGTNPTTGASQIPTAPRVDDVWIATFPEHAEWRWDPLDHHHVPDASSATGGGPYAMPVPSSIHSRPGPSWGPFHGKPNGL
jgi:hypothetical protein